MKTEQIVSDSIDKLLNRMEWGDEFSFSDSTKGVRLRLDCELKPTVNLRECTRVLLLEEITDLVINGDIYITTDPLLKTMDGEKKRNQKLSSLTFNQARLGITHRDGKEEIEYMLYVTIDAKFG